METVLKRTRLTHLQYNGWVEHSILKFVAESKCLAQVNAILAVAYLHVVQV